MCTYFTFLVNIVQHLRYLKTNISFFKICSLDPIPIYLGCIQHAKRNGKRCLQELLRCFE